MGKRQLLTHLIVFMIASVLGLKIAATSVQAGDYRVQKLANFFASHNSPLVYYASDFVYYADQNGLDYRLLPAISGVESTFGKHYITGSYNVYGWGGGVIYFQSWADGIAKIAAGLKENYVNRGATTVEQIGRIYCPPSFIHWSAGVRQFMNQIEATDLYPYQIVSFNDSQLDLPLTI